MLVRDGSSRCDAHKHIDTGRFGDPRRGSRHKRGYGTEWDRKRKAVLARDRGLCQQCKPDRRITVARNVDHKVPKAEGGTDDEDNLWSLCDTCHAEKTAREALRGRGLR